MSGMTSTDDPADGPLQPPTAYAKARLYPNRRRLSAHLRHSENRNAPNNATHTDTPSQS